MDGTPSASADAYLAALEAVIEILVGNRVTSVGIEPPDPHEPALWAIVVRVPRDVETPRLPSRMHGVLVVVIETDEEFVAFEDEGVSR